MKTLVSFFLLFFFCTVVSSPAFALTDEQYHLFVKESLQFELAEAQLNSIWEMIKVSIPKENFKALQKEQREWNKNRDAEARAIQEQSNGILSLADSYAKATNERAIYIKDTYLFGNAGRRTPVSTAADDITGKYLRGKTDSIVIKKLSEDAYSVTVSADDGSGRPDGWSEFTGTGKIENDILIVINQQRVHDSEWVNGQFMEKPTSRTVSGTLKIYLKQHSDFQTTGEYLQKELRKMKHSQVAIIEEPNIAGGDDAPSRYEFYTQGIPDLSGLYTKK